VFDGSGLRESLSEEGEIDMRGKRECLMGESGGSVCRESVERVFDGRVERESWMGGERENLTGDGRGRVKGEGSEGEFLGRVESESLTGECRGRG